MSYRLEKSVWVPETIANVFDFFSDAGNLELLTPPWLGFTIVTPRPIAMHEGTRINYRISLRGIPMGWESEITVWKPPFEFVDEQIRGPYRRWHHRHTFTPQNNGTLVTDEVTYDVLGGAIVNRLFVRGELEKIFAFREETLRKRFTSPGA